MGDRITYIADVHKDGIAVAVAEGGLRGEVRDYGRRLAKFTHPAGHLIGLPAAAARYIVDSAAMATA